MSRRLDRALLPAAIRGRSSPGGVTSSGSPAGRAKLGIDRVHEGIGVLDGDHLRVEPADRRKVGSNCAPARASGTRALQLEDCPG